jgi:hypothetical protein
LLRLAQGLPRLVEGLSRWLSGYCGNPPRGFAMMAGVREARTVLMF